MALTIAALNAALEGRYKILRELGAGGMATVFLADDLKHDRKVAVKVLKPELAAVLGAERFVVEIKTTASLQHPHILPLFDSGTADGFLYYVMPFIEGETLRDKLNRETQFGVDESVRIARDVADALDYAHRHGVIHRDIKPENILLHDGRPMVADFGIALAVSAAAGGRMTETGLSLGTPHYMSPEQATADKDISARADIYSLASVLYEMLAGEPPHVGGSAQQIIMKIIAEPAQPVTKLRKAVPANVAAALGKALEKLPADRFDSAKAFSDALANPSFKTDATYESHLALAVRPKTTLAFAAGGVVLSVLAIMGWLRTPAEPGLHRYAFIGGSEVWDSPAPTAAPNDSFIVFVKDLGQARTELRIKRRENIEATRIPGTDGATGFAISPDSKQIVFVIPGQLSVVPVSGGEAKPLLTANIASGQGVAWLDDGTILFVRTSRGWYTIWRIPSTGGEPAVLIEGDTLAQIYPEPIHGKNAALIARCEGTNACTMTAVDLGTGKVHPLLPGVSSAQYATTGHLVYVHERKLMVAPFDADRLEMTGQGVIVGDSIGVQPLSVRLSRSGTLVTRVGGGEEPWYDMVAVDRTGRMEAIDTAWRFKPTGFRTNHGWALSPDGTKLAIGLRTNDGDDIYVKEFPRGPAMRITYDKGADSRPRWVPGGRAVTFASYRDTVGLYRRNADATGKDSLIAIGGYDEGMYSPDGAWIMLRSNTPTANSLGRNIVGIRVGKDTALVKLLATRFDEEAITMSPDSKWMAYQSDEAGRNEVFIRSFPNTDAEKKQISNGGGDAPLWSRDGRELYFLNAKSEMMMARVTTTPKLVVSEPVKLFTVPPELLRVEYAFYTPWDITRDGKFVMARRISSADQVPSVVVAEGWERMLRLARSQ